MPREMETLKSHPAARSKEAVEFTLSTLSYPHAVEAFPQECDDSATYITLKVLAWGSDAHDILVGVCIYGMSTSPTQVTDSSIIGIQVQDSESDWLITRDGTKNYKGEPADKSKTGGLRVLPFLFGSEFAEKTAGNGLALNLISYLFYVKHLHLADAANLTTNFLGSSQILTLLGGFLADMYFGRYWTIIIFTLVVLLGLGVLIINATLDEFKCLAPTCPPAYGADKALIYVGLYLVAAGAAGIKSSVPGLGADQLEKADPNEAKHLSHYFNWYTFVLVAGVLVGQTLLTYIQDRSWSWGFGTLLMIMFVSLIFLVSIRRRCRYKVPQGSPFTPLARVLVAAIRNRKLSRPSISSSVHHKSGSFHDVSDRPGDKLKIVQTDNMRWLDKAAIVPEGMTAAQRGKWSLATVTEVENFKMVLRLIPILATTWFFWTAEAQFLTFTVTQARTTNRMWGDFEVPPASCAAMKTIFSLLALIVYDKLFIRVARKFTGRPSGITTLQRVGVGLALSVMSMIVAALVERRRLEEVNRLHWELKPRLPMESFSMFWYAPQYFFMGVAEAFLFPGQVDFFYNEAPDNMQSLGSSLFLATLAIGSFSSSAIVSTVNSASDPDWLQDNINTGRLDYFFWTMAVLSAINFVAFLFVAKFHMYKQTYLESSSSDEKLKEEYRGQHN